MNSSLAPTYWSQLCQDSKSVALPVLIDKARGTSAAAICSYLVAGLISLLAVIRWFRLEADLQIKVWRLYGRFCLLVSAGSFMGVISWAANMLFLENDFRSTQDRTLTPVQRHVVVAIEHTWHAVFLVFCTPLSCGRALSSDQFCLRY
jgi:hypothetical protein